MKLCRFDEDRLGVVKGDMVHDVTAAQDEIRKSARYDMKGDAVIAALPALALAHRGDGGESAGQADFVGEASVAGGAPVEGDGGADQLQEAHRGNAQPHRPAEGCHPHAAEH